MGSPHGFMDEKDIKRIAILLPFSAKSSRLRAEANSMLRAAELALFAREDDNVLLIALDSAGTVSGRAASNAKRRQARRGYNSWADFSKVCRRVRRNCSQVRHTRDRIFNGYLCCG